ncbi:MAG: hypothetical protein QXN68_06425 [Thermoplasmata archaeon]
MPPLTYIYFSGIRGLLLPLFNFTFQHFQVDYIFSNTIVRMPSSQEQRIPINNTSTLRIDFTVLLDDYATYFFKNVTNLLNRSCALPYLPETFKLAQNVSGNETILLPNINLNTYFFEIFRRKSLLYFYPKTKEYTALDIQEINTQNNSIKLVNPPEMELSKSGVLAPLIKVFIEEMTFQELNFDTSYINVKAIEIYFSEEMWQ